MGTVPSKKRKRYRFYTPGQINRLVDDLVHPFFRKNEAVRLLDGVLHALVEQNSEVSVQKFVRYNLHDVMKKILKKGVSRDRK